MIERVIDFQIVNGGQTTASIFHPLKKEKVDISHVVVQIVWRSGFEYESPD